MGFSAKRFLTSSVKAASILALAVSAVSTSVSTASAADLTWGGTYRAEANWIKNPELGGAKSNKAYLLHHLVLAPKLVVADGITVYSRLDILNNNLAQSGQVAGDVFGNGPGSATAATSTSDSDPLSRAQNRSAIDLTSIYVSWAHEFGQLVVGRTPIHFGLGTTFNAGTGLFDHFIDTKDIVGYKIVFGNLSIFPMIGKVSENNLGANDDVNDYILHAQYDNPETELSIGAIYQLRTVGTAGNNLPTNGVIGGVPAGTGQTSLMTPPTSETGGDSTIIGGFIKRKIRDFTFGVEGDFQSGNTGLRAADGSQVELGGFGVAAELAWARESSKLSGNLKFGMASGDDPNTTKYEGYQFSRNYDVALLMFNHPLGQRDVLRTQALTGSVDPSVSNETDVRNSIDSEAISNTIYVAPSLQYQWKDTLSFGGTVTYGILTEDPIVNGDSSKDLGFELDLNLTWKPYERLTWITQAGFLFPGAAWQGGSLGLDNSFAYGLVTKAAISF